MLYDLEIAEDFLRCLLDEHFYELPYEGMFEKMAFMERVLKRIHELSKE